MVIMFEESYHIKLEGYEGPFELLLDFIEKKKLFINDISLSKVTDDFIAYINDKDNFPLGLSAQFVLVASTLLLVKSKSLLPSLELTTEEEASIHDLEARLKLYERFKALAAHVKELFCAHPIYERERGPEPPAVFAPSGEMDVPHLHAAALSALANLPKKEAMPEVRIQKAVTLEETIEKLTHRIKAALRVSFSEFAGHAKGRAVSREEKVGVIVGFLAMLELAKQGAIAVRQESAFDDIHMETEGVGVPHYT